MSSLTWRIPAGGTGLSGREISAVALMLSFPVVGLDLFLRTASGRFSAQPYAQVGHWLADSLVMLPLFVLGVWAGDGIASLAGLGMARRADVLKRAVVVTLFAAVAQVPAWFLVDRWDNPVTAQPLVAPQAHDSGDVYWVAPWVVLTLVCACLAPAAVWAARAIGHGLTGRAAVRHPGTRLPRAAAAFTNAGLLAALLAVVVAFAWALHQAADHAFASQVYYTSAATVITRHSQVLSAARGARTAGSSVTAAPFAVAYQVAHALQDGLAGQAVGLPIAVLGLLWVTRGRNQHQPQPPQGGAK